MSDSGPLLRVEGLTTSFQTDAGRVEIIRDISFEVDRGQTLGIVGESGCGKSVTSLSLMRLLPPDLATIDGGKVLLAGQDLVELSERQMQKVRGKRLAMIFQEPMTSLNPVYRVGSQLVEALRLHMPLSRSAARKRAAELLDLVGIADPAERLDAYPHEMSGGMRQRVMIAMALSCEPDVLIADEPTTALDVTIQAQILHLLAQLQKKLGMALILITHDLGVVAQCADRLLVMYAGQVVEEGAVGDVLRSPEHPYTQGLLRSIPPEDPREFWNKGHGRLPTIGGTVPPLSQPPPGCRFHPRCEHVRPECSEQEVNLRPFGASKARCLRLGQLAPYMADSGQSSLRPDSLPVPLVGKNQA